MCFYGCTDDDYNYSFEDFDIYEVEPEPFIHESEGNLIGNPAYVVVDTLNNVIVADDSGMEILYFDNDGHFLKKLGRRGRGPGEFQDLTGMNIDNSNNLIVADQINTTFTVIGDEDIETHLFSEGVLWPRQIVPLENGYVLAYNTYLPFSESETSFSSDSLQGNFIFHFTEDFESINFSFGNLLNLPLGEDIFFRTWTGFGVGSLLYKDRKLLYVPRTYGGELYSYDLKAEEVEMYSGTALHETPFTRLYNPPIPRHAVQISGRTPSAAIVHSESLKLLKIDDDKVIHFSFQLLEEEKKLFFEVFDASLKLLKTGVVEGLGEFPLRIDGNAFKVEAFDGQRFYGIDKRKSGTERLFTFNLNI